MVKALVTGAAGFVGASVARELLRQGLEVRALVRKSSDRRNLTGLDVEMTEGDVQDIDSLARAIRGCQYVFHLAALYSQEEKDVEMMYHVNVEGTKNLLQVACRGNLERFIHTSTIGAIGRAADGTLPNEDTLFDGWESSSHYVKSKYLGEQAAIEAGREGLPVVVVHPCAPIGAGDIKPTVTGQRIIDFLSATMPSYLPGGINFVDVEDVAKGHFLAAVRGRIGERYILGSRNLSLADFCGLMALVTGSKVPVVGRRNPLVTALKYFRERHAAPTPIGGPQSLTCDCSRTVLELELPQTPIEIALEKAVNWFLENGYVNGRRGNKWIS